MRLKALNLVHASRILAQVLFAHARCPYRAIPQSLSGPIFVSSFLCLWAFVLFGISGGLNGLEAPSLECLQEFECQNPLDAKMALDMSSAAEHTRPLNWKEGLHVGPKHTLAGLPLHAKTQFPDQMLPV